MDEEERYRPRENPREQQGRIVQDYSELKVYQLGFASAMQIFRSSQKWPKEEKFALTDQIRRSSRSVCSNIGEAWRKRRYPLHFVSKLSDSDMEAAETIVWLNFALECGYMDTEEHRQLSDNYDYICRMLSKMMDNPDSWCNNRKA
jgi:four helix bundle protein